MAYKRHMLICLFADAYECDEKKNKKNKTKAKKNLDRNFVRVSFPFQTLQLDFYESGSFQ